MAADYTLLGLQKMIIRLRKDSSSTTIQLAQSMNIKMLHEHLPWLEHLRRFPIHESEHETYANEVIVVIDFTKENRHLTALNNTDDIPFLYSFLAVPKIPFISKEMPRASKMISDLAYQRN